MAFFQESLNVLLQYSIIPEEYKGNFALAQKGLQTLNHQKEEIAFAEAVLHLLQGNIKECLRLFDDLQHELENNHPLQLRINFYRWLTQTWQYNIFPDGNGAGALEIQARWQSVQEIEKLQKLIDEQSRNIDSSTYRLEKLLAFRFMPGLQSSRSFIQQAKHNASGISSQDLLEIGINQCEDFIRDTEYYQTSPALQAYAYLAAADLCHRAGDEQRKQEFLSQSEGIYRKTADNIGLARCKVMQGDWLSAPFSSPLVLNYSVVDAYSAGSYQDWRIEEQEFGFEGADLERAANLYEEAADLFLGSGADRGLGHINLRRSYLHWANKDFTLALEKANKAQADFKRGGDLKGVHHAKTFILLNEMALGRFQHAIAMAKTIGEWGRDSGSFSYTLGLGILINRVARHWVIRTVDFEKALSGYRTAKVLFYALDAPVNMAQSSVDEGKTCELMSEFDQALIVYESAADAFEKAIRRDPLVAADLQRFAIMLVQSHYNLGLKMMDGKSIARSMQKIKAIQMAGSPPDSHPQDSRGQSMDLIIAQLADTVLSQASVFAPLYQAVEARNEGDTQRAESLFSKAERTARTQPNNTFLLATVMGQQHRYQEAKALFDQYLSASMAGQGISGDVLKMLEMFGGEQAKQQILKQQSRLNEQAMTFMIRTKHFEEAKSYAEKLEQANGHNWYMQTDQPWLTLSDYGEMYEGLGDLSLEKKDTESALRHWISSKKYFDSGIEQLEAQRNRLSRDELKTALGGGMGVQFLYFCTARLCVKKHLLHLKMGDKISAQSFLEQSFDISEKNKSKALLDLIEDSQQLRQTINAESDAIREWREKSTLISLYKGMLAYEHRSQQAQAERITALENNIQLEENKRLDLENKIQQESPEFYAMITEEATTLSLSEVPQYLPAKSTLLQFFYLDQDLIIWAINDQGQVKAYHKKYDAKKLSREARAFHKVCQNQEAWENKSSLLSTILLDPLEEDLFSSAERLIIIPYADLHLVPFAALMQGDDLLLAKYQISYLPSASTIQFLGKPKSNNWTTVSSLTVGNPSNMAYSTPFGEELDFQSLKGAGLEAEYIAHLTGGKKLSGEEATRANFLKWLPDYELLHFSTHGYLSEHFPLMSAILLANGEALTVYDLIGLQLKARLVVMSACQTGLGERKGGDDLLGLTRGLLGAGAESAIVTQWSVGDSSTAILMADMYRHLRKGSGTPAKALRKAQLQLRKLSKEEGKKRINELRASMEMEQTAQFSEQIRAGRRLPPPPPSTSLDHPFYWAAFVHIGV